MRAMWRRVRRGLNRMFSTPLGTRIVRPVIARADRFLFRASGRRLTFSGWLNPTLILESVGSKSGQLRRQPLVYGRDGQRWVVAGTNFGQDHHPAWTGNLLATPEATIHIRGDAIPVKAVPVIDEAERQRLWAVMDDIYPGYRRYREVTDGIREIRIFSLERR